MMNHEERIDLAEKITGLLLEKYEDDVLLGGIYGSTAKGTDTEYSDLEMLFIVRDASNSKTFEFAFNMIQQLLLTFPPMLFGTQALF